MAEIVFSNVSLEYPVRENRAITLKELVLRGLFWRRKPRMQSIQALGDLTFSIGDGERVGIIGLNGAGKSTLLRTIGGIYPIQSGTRSVRGSICSIHDLHVGFELNATGWQNISLRSYFQGETARTLKAKLHEIAEFTELGEHLDLPLRCYSRGMIMRLAFAIATARHPEILLIDEVFGAGDVVFQKKAERRMRDIMHRAQIVVMASHQLEFFQEFCTQVIWLQQGRLRALGPARKVIEKYLDESPQPESATQPPAWFDLRSASPLPVRDEIASLRC